MKTGARIPLLLVSTVLLTYGQDTGRLVLPGAAPVAFPEWLAGDSQAQKLVTTGTGDHAVSTYITPVPAAGVAAHYERQLQLAGIGFRGRHQGPETTIDAEGEKFTCHIAVRQDGDMAHVEVNYTVKRVAPVAAGRGGVRYLPALLLEWPQWLTVSGGRKSGENDVAAGRTVKDLASTCPGDVLGKGSQGCLERSFETSRKLQDVYDELSQLLEHKGYGTELAGADGGPNVLLGKSIGDVFATITVREYPDRAVPGYFRQVSVFLRQVGAQPTKAEITFLVKNEGNVPPKQAAVK